MTPSTGFAANRSRDDLRLQLSQWMRQYDGLMEVNTTTPVFAAMTLPKGCVFGRVASPPLFSPQGRWLTGTHVWLSSSLLFTPVECLCSGKKPAAEPDKPLLDFIRDVFPVPSGALQFKQQRFRELIVVMSALEFGITLSNTIHLIRRVVITALQEDVASVRGWTKFWARCGSE